MTDERRPPTALQSRFLVAADRYIIIYKRIRAQQHTHSAASLVSRRRRQPSYRRLVRKVMCVLHNIYNIIYNISFAARAFDSATAEAVSLSLYRYILLSYSVIARGRRLVAILTAVYMPMIILWRSTRAVRETMTVCRREK